MSIPDYESLMLPVLEFASDNKEHRTSETVAQLGASLQIPEVELSKLLPSGQRTVFANRVGWAISYLKRAGVLFSVRRGIYKITPRGFELLKQDPKAIDNELLCEFSKEFKEIYRAWRNTSEAEPSDELPVVAAFARQTPEEQIDQSFQTLNAELAANLLQRVLLGSPEFFERLVIELLVAMGYGGSRKEAGERVGRSGDGGVDGIIKEDRLGLDTIYIQAKRWENGVSRPEIQKFVGALQGVRAKKGVFITTSRYTEEAMQYANNVDTKLVLIDGATLARYMIDFGIGVTAVTRYELKRIDSDYFDDE